MTKMNSCEKKVKQYIIRNELISRGNAVLAGVSGGADSVCLFHILLKLREELSFSLYVVHINHKIREAAEGEALYVKELCEKNKVPFYQRDINIPEIAAISTESEEEVARNERYKAFGEVAAGIEKEYGQKVVIATAHNRNDQAETMIHNLFRGSKLKGLSGILPTRERDGYVLIRPILVLGRGEIEEYLRDISVEWCTDESNLTDNYTRNRIRHHILPYAEENINSQAVKHAAEAADYFAEVENYLEKQTISAENRTTKVINGDVVIDCEDFQKEDDFIKKRLLMREIRRTAPGIKDVMSVHIDSMCKLTKNTEGTSSLNLPYGIEVVRNYSKLIIRKKPENVNQCETFLISKEQLDTEGLLEIYIPNLGKLTFQVKIYDLSAKIPEGEYTKWFNYDKIIQSMQFRRRRTGDVIEIGNGRKTLKKFMIDEKIPSDVRDKMYILAEGDMVLWVPSYRMGSGYKVVPDTEKILEVKLETD